MWGLRKVKAPRGSMLTIYHSSCETAHFFVECFHELGMNLGFVFLSLSVGQLLCVGMILSGIILYFYLKRIAHQHT